MSRVRDIYIFLTRCVAASALLLLGIPTIRHKSLNSSVRNASSKTTTSNRPRATIVSNHVSALDILAFMACFGFPSFVAKVANTFRDCIVLCHQPPSRQAALPLGLRISNTYCIKLYFINAVHLR